MKRVSLIGILLLAVFIQVDAQKSFKADKEATIITWNGKKIIGEHTGTISLKEGWLSVDNAIITGGEFIVDMTTIKDTDLKDEKTRGMLESHLKSDDFFGVDKFPLSRLVIKESTPFKNGNATVKGDLTIKGTTHPVEFVTTVLKVKQFYTYSAVITVDRTLYDIRYGSGKFFSNLGDKAINDEFSLEIKLVVSE